MTSEKDPDIWRTHELLSKAQLLLQEIQELLDWCTSTGPSPKTQCTMVQQECQINIEEDEETLVVEGFRFESASSVENLRRPPERRMTDGYHNSFYQTRSAESNDRLK